MGSRHAVVVSYLALFIALGGTAVAIQGKRSVKADDLATGAVTSRAIGTGAVDTGDIRGLSIKARNIDREAISRNKLKEQSVDTRSIVNRSIQSQDLDRLTEIPVGASDAIFGLPEGIRLRSPMLDWSPTDFGEPPVRFQMEPGGGGGVVLNGSLGSLGGYLRFIRSAGTPPGSSNAASLFVRQGMGGKLELAVVFPGGSIEVLATQP